MSFLAPSQRAYEPLPHPELSHLPRLPMNALASFDNLPAQSIHPALQPSMPPANPHSTQHPAQYLDRSPIVLPKVGETRCYWVLLTSELNFVYLDPVLASHLQDQADLLIGKSLLSFVHPDEQASAEQDLGGVLDSRTLHGSVTRVRYSRLSRVRRQLGYQGPAPAWQDADKIAVDANYMAVDIVINWAADGVVLCFIHAVVDLTPRDNDEQNKTGWTNWCGTPCMNIQQVDFLYKQLRQRVPQPPSRDRVFQILLNQPDRPLWFSWPEVEPIRGPTSKDFARLASEVNINNNPGGTDAKTSCTRRFKALQKMEQFEGSPEVESIFIPYGSIIFACHKVNSTGSKNGIPYANNAPTQYYDHGNYSLPPVPGPASYPGNDYGQAHTSSGYTSQSWSSAPESSSYHQWSQTAPMSSSPSVSSIRSSSYGSTSQSAQQQHQWSSQPPAFLDSSPTSYSFPPSSASYGQAPSNAAPTTNAPAAAPAEDVVPASRNTHRRGSAANREQYGNGGRGSGNPPIGIMQCISCKVTQSPEWRKGPSGKKDLCNACGLRYARSRAKKEGGTQRRRKDKALTNMPSKSDHSPSASPVNMPYNTMRRSSVYDDATPFAASASLPPAGNDVFTSQPAGLHGMTPSPSPPSATGNGFLPYSAHALESQNSTSSDQRGHAHFASQYYSMPPPIPGPQHGLHGGGHPATTLPRLEPMMAPFASRMSPAMHSPTTPLATSPLGSHYPASSYEREKREKERERGVPLAAEQRKY